MFIRKRTRKGNEYYGVVESERCDDTVRQRYVLNIGRIDTMTPERRKEVEADLAELEEGPKLIRRFRELLLEHGYTDEVYFGSEISPKEALDYGPVAALTAVAEKLELASVLEESLPPKGGGPPLGKLLLVQAIARCLEPRSIEGTVDWVPTTALGGLLELAPEQITRDTLYNSLDYVTQEGIERVHTELWTRVREHYDTPQEPIFYDLTTSYFEGTKSPLTEYGYSSEHRPDKEQVVVGVAVNPDMIPVHHDVYPGNTSHSTTVDDAIGRVDELGIEDPVFVMDKGCATGQNRKRLRERDPNSGTDPAEYVAALKVQGKAKAGLAGLSPEEFSPVNMPEDAQPLAVTEVDPPDSLAADDVRWIATYNEAKAADDEAFRQTSIERAGDALNRLAKRQRGQRPLSKQELLCRIKNIQSRHGVTDLIDVTVNERGRPRLSWSVEESAVEQAGRLDGKAMFETTCSKERLTPREVAYAYRDRDTVEKFIQSVKDVVRLRPHYVRTEQHVRARIFLCVLSVLLLAVLELELREAGREMTGMRALDILRGVRRVEFSAGSDEAVVVKTTELSSEQAELAHVFDLSI